MTVFFVLIGIICGILNTILFCKVWNMCDNVAKLTQHFCSNVNKEAITTEMPNDQVNNKTKFNIGDLVVRLGDETQMKIININDNGIYCQISGNMFNTGIYKEDEIESFDKYWANKKK